MHEKVRGVKPFLEKFFSPKPAEFTPRNAEWCGHYVQQQVGYLLSRGDRMVHDIQPHPDNGTFRFCRACLSQAAIRCSWCRKPIFPGTPVTLYTATDDDRFRLDMMNQAVVHSHNPFQLIGCGRRGCAEDERHYAGLWMMRPPPQHSKFGWCAAIQPFVDADETIHTKFLEDTSVDDFYPYHERQLADGLIIPESML